MQLKCLPGGHGVLGCKILVSAQLERLPISRRFRGRQLIDDVRKRLAPLIQEHMTCEIEPGDVDIVEHIARFVAQEADGLELIGREPGCPPVENGA